MRMLHGDPAGAVPLDELRWQVFAEEMHRNNRSAEYVHEAYRVSFNRTVRSGGLPIWSEKVSMKRALSLPGLISRVALYRLKNQTLISGFLDTTRGEARLVKTAYRTKEDRRLVTLLRCEFFSIERETYRAEYEAVVMMPLNQSLTIVSKDRLTLDKLREISEVVWHVKIAYP